MERRSQMWKQYKRSHFPFLEQRFAAAIDAWAIRTGLIKGNKPNTLTQKSDKDKDDVGFFVRNHKEVERRLKSEPFRDAVGQQLRRDLQWALKSPTIPGGFSPAVSVAILGVGASLHAGMPTTERIASAVLGSPRVKEDLRRDRALKSLAKTNNIEECLGVVDTGAWSEWAHRGGQDSYSRLARQVRLAYVRTLLKSQRRAKRVRDFRIVTRRFLSHLYRQKSWAIISFNQDTVVERELMRPEYKRIRFEKNWDPVRGGFGMQIPRDSRGFAQRPKGILRTLPAYRVYKPHGSIAWSRKNEDQGPAEVNIDCLLWKWKPKAPLRDSIILPPSYLKDYDDVLIWRTLSCVTFELLNAQVIRVVGFRLRPDDTMVSHLIRLSLTGNTRRHGWLHLIGPDAAGSDPGTMGHAWLPVTSMLAERGWRIVRHPVKFKEYVKHCLRDERNCLSGCVGQGKRR